MTLPVLKKCQRVQGKSVVLRDIEENDAEFILALRLDPQKSQFLSGTSSSLADQTAWIRSYKSQNNQAYFLVCNTEGDRLGCIRMYDPVGNSYCWGSWLMISGLSPFISIESALLVYAYGLHLGFDDARITVHQANKHVWSFHEKFSGAELTHEDELERHYVVKRENILKALRKYSNLLPNDLNIDSI